MSDNKKNNQQARQKVLTGILTLTGFVSLSAQSGLASKVLTVMDNYLIPSAAASNAASHRVAILDNHLINELGTDTILIDGQQVFLVNKAGEKTDAPNGLYKLSDGSVIKVKDGKIYQQAKLSSENNFLAMPAPWLDVNWSQDSRHNDPRSGDTDLMASIRTNVQDTLSKINEA